MGRGMLSRAMMSLSVPCGRGRVVGPGVGMLLTSMLAVLWALEASTRATLSLALSSRSHTSREYGALARDLDLLPERRLEEDLPEGDLERDLDDLRLLKRLGEADLEYDLEERFLLRLSDAKGDLLLDFLWLLECDRE